MISLAGTAYATTTLFIQKGPALPNQGVAAQCDKLTPSQPGVVPGNKGAILFDCSPIEFGTNAPALIVSATTTMTASYTFPTGYSGCTPNVPNNVFVPNAICAIAAAGDDENGVNQTCGGIGGTAVAIPSTSAVTLGVANWYYCIEYSQGSLSNAIPPGLGAFSVTWSTP